MKKRGGIVKDGIISPGNWAAAKEPRVLWLLKEANYQNDGEGDLRSWLRGVSAQGFTGWGNDFQSTWLLVTRTVWALSTKDAEAVFSEEGFPDRPDLLKNIAVINLIPTGGESRATESELKAEARKPDRQEELLRRVQEMHPRPNLVIAANILHFFPKGCELRNADWGADPKRQRNGFPGRKTADGTVWLNAYHPGQTTIVHEEYVSRILEAWRAYSQEPPLVES